MTSAACANCDAPLTGPYCASCGQHAHASARTLGALLHEAWHLLTHVDARLWSTLVILMGRPGRLTQEHFAGHRARYMPPFQLYFVISLIFFGLASLSTHLRPQHPGAAVPSEAVRINVERRDCERIEAETFWLSQALAEACRHQAVDGGKSLTRSFLASIPKMMFIFVPLMAFIMLLLYLRSRRFYVEHLIFFLHAHAALYVAIIASLLIAIAARYVPKLTVASTVADYALLLYAIWYMYGSLRRFYGQGRIVTAVKFAAISVAYLACLALTLFGTLLINTLAT